MTIDAFREFQAVRACLLQYFQNGRYGFLCATLRDFKMVTQFDIEKYIENKIFRH